MVLFLNSIHKSNEKSHKKRGCIAAPFGK